MDIKKILEHLPHRYPMLLVDRVLEMESGKSITALKNVTINEPFFQGHFPHHPVMPGVLILEALAQTAAILSFTSASETANSNAVYYLVGIDGARFKRPVVPGDQLILKIDVLRITRGIWKYSGKALVDDQVVAQAEIMCTMRHISDDE
ncbi:3-hydroxyacyl-ACP dehydratase FabZ [Pigmentiphaga aceris]|jgi:3-hydroxyacyl-[acyl-carrier-protein] dehydratase|uniref:3-hydroxyacyl-[acyl-carrier-protein] dehydratase FabZ n=1 Tax=Pigmentiphaga aceris TaxID=1940612 RepID=A0A5C0AV18_9BURK|nr:3-hydroxyacyl-ACP dehydratase FabZ [Pigmentiphaga aceris]QEI06269.1 3-hydroxyacyl-ACP dehydratase FabZ [Pigmentiphaga aceris]